MLFGTLLGRNTPIPRGCHPERSEGSCSSINEIPHCIGNDRFPTTRRHPRDPDIKNKRGILPESQRALKCPRTCSAISAQDRGTLYHIPSKARTLLSPTNNQRQKYLLRINQNPTLGHIIAKVALYTTRNLYPKRMSSRNPCAIPWNSNKLTP